MSCTQITVETETPLPGVNISNVTFGTMDYLGLSFEPLNQADCKIPGSYIGRPIVIGFNFTGTGLINILTVSAAYKDYLGNSVVKSQTGVVSALSGSGIIKIGRNYHAGTYTGLTVTANKVI